jgi:hypothetical protein
VDQFQKAFKGIDSAIKQGTARALNRALSSTKTKVVRQLRQDTGLPTEVITARTRFKKATLKDLRVILAIAVKFGIALSKFKPSEKKVKVVQKNGRKVTHYGVTAKIGQLPRQLVAGAFMLSGKTGEAVLGRKQAYSDGIYSDPNAPKYPTASLKSDVFTESAKAQQVPAKEYLQQAFDNNAEHEIEYAVQSKFKGNTVIE